MITPLKSKPSSALFLLLFIHCRYTMAKLLLVCLCSLISILFLYCGPSQALYLPGVAPNDYTSDSNVPLFVNSLTPMSNQQKSLISYDYYDERFHFCKPEGGPENQPESLGSVLFGDRIMTSPFKVTCTCVYVYT